MTHAREAPIVVAVGSWWHVRQVRAYHRLYPEVRGEGRSRRDAIDHLAHQLTRALDSAPGRGHRAAIERALDEVRALVREASRRRRPHRRGTATVPDLSAGHRPQTE